MRYSPSFHGGIKRICAGRAVKGQVGHHFGVAVIHFFGSNSDRVDAQVHQSDAFETLGGLSFAVSVAVVRRK